MAGKQDLVEQGSQFSAFGLLAAADTIADKVDEHAATFKKFRIDSAWKQRVKRLSSEIETALDDRELARTDILPTGERLGAVVEAGKEWRSDCLAYADNAFDSGATRDKFTAAGRGVGASIPGLIRSLGKMVPIAKAHATALGKEGASPGFAAEGKTALAKLKVAHVAHRKALAAISPAAKKLQAKKGELYLLLKKATRVARRKRLGSAKQFSVRAIARANRRGGQKNKATGADRLPTATV